MSTERWLIVRKDGSLVLHEENDGWAFLRNGPQASEEPITAESLRRQYPILYEEYMQAMAISANKTLRISHSAFPVGEHCCAHKLDVLRSARHGHDGAVR